MAHRTLPDMLKSLDKNDSTLASFKFKNYYFFDHAYHSQNENKEKQLVSNLHMIQHTIRSRNSTGNTLYKSITRTTSNAKSIGAHVFSRCKNDKICRTQWVPETTAFLAHFRNGCQKMPKHIRCSDFTESLVQDSTILKYKDDLKREVEKTLLKLNFLQGKTKTKINWKM